jgi:hypothetical protein
MSIEVFGFIVGLACVLAGGYVFFSIERWRLSHPANGRRPTTGRRGNALIWPSH